MLTKTGYFYLPVSILVGNANEIWQFYVQFVDKFVTPKNSKFAKISGLKFMLKAYLSKYLTYPNK